MKKEKGNTKVLLVYPEYPDTFWSFSYALKQFTSEKAAFPPLGLMTVGAMLPQNWNLKLIDMNVKELGIFGSYVYCLYFFNTWS